MKHPNTKHPIQPLEKDKYGTLRFKENAIVRHLLDHGGIHLNQLASMEFTDDDRQQFAQLIGYSLCGYGNLSYVDDEAYETAEAMAKAGKAEDDAKIAYLEDNMMVKRKAVYERDAEFIPFDLVSGGLLLIRRGSIITVHAESFQSRNISCMVNKWEVKDGFDEVRQMLGFPLRSSPERRL